MMLKRHKDTAFTITFMPLRWKWGCTDAMGCKSFTMGPFRFGYYNPHSANKSYNFTTKLYDK